MVIHPIIVANILKEYGYDDKVVAAGYLHDTVEDTVTTIDDIEKILEVILKVQYMKLVNQINLKVRKKEKNILFQILKIQILDIKL